MLFQYSKKYIFISSILTPCLFGAMSTMVSAEEVVLPDIEVRADRMQENNNASLNTSDSASLLSDEPGVTLYRAGGVSSLPVIHGLADDRVRVKLDGMDLIASCPNHMNPPLSYIDPTNIDNIKVYAGITPVSVGGDSLGGTILVNSAQPEFAAAGAGNLVKGQIGTFYRSNNNAQGSNISATFATESFNASYSGSTSKADNYEAGKNFKTSPVTGRIGHTLALDEVGSTAYETSNQTLGLAFKSGNHLVEAKFGYQNMPEQLYPNQRMDLLDNEQKRINLRYLGEFDWGALEARAYHETVDHYMDFGADKRYWYGNGAPPTGSGGPAGVGGNGFPCTPVGTATCAAGMPMYTEGKTTGASVKGDIKLSQQDLLRVGAELQRYGLDDWWEPSGAGMSPNTFLNINNGERDRTALFAEWENKLNAHWQTLAGVRYEHVKTDSGNVHGYANSNGMVPIITNQLRDSSAFNAQNHKKTDNNWDVTLLSRYVANPNTDLELGFARKVRSPNLYERYTWSTWQMAALMNNTVGDGNGYFGNVDLKPEKAHTISTTLDWHAANRDWELKATPYYTHVTDYIDAVQLTPTTNAFTTLRYTNQSARLYGLDVSGHMPLAQTSVGLFTLKGLLNYTNGENRDTGDDLYNIMPLNGKLTLTHNYQDWDNALEVQMVKAKDHTSDARNEIKTAGYSLVNLRSSYNWKQARLDFGVENLFDKHYYLPLGGAYVGQGTTMTTALVPTGSVPLWGTAVPGMGRSVNVGLTLKY
ncbi:MAG: TonB-dependent receptor [Sulfuritalea sp.]|nr:TonB-dependent receptor [Sulfuritalea sp.]